MSLIAERLSQVVLGDPIQFSNLTLFPLLGEGTAQPTYRLLDAALADGTARVTEVSEAGNVPELRFVNQGDLPVLLLDGEELIGAKQNRILNLTILAPAHKTIVIPVTCVEAGRWHAETAQFGSARRAHFAAGRARKARDVTESLRRRGSRESDQGAAWRAIDQRLSRMRVASASRAAADLYRSYRDRLDEFLRALTPQPTQCGALFAVNGRFLGLDLFDSSATLATLLQKLIESYALDAIDAASEETAANPDSPHVWLDAVANAQVERFAALGEGEDWRLLGAGLAGGALVKDGRLIHLCTFRAEDDDAAEMPDPRGRQGRLELALRTDRCLIRTGGLSKRYLHVHLQAPPCTGKRAPVDLALVVDRSGSMAGSKWKRACEAALAAIDRLAPGDRVAVVVFDDRIDVALPLMPAGPDTRRAAAGVMERIAPRGSTNLGEGWLTGCGLIGRDGVDGRLSRCLLLTDGEANTGITEASELARHAAELRQLGVLTSAFGVGDDYNEVLLGTLADAGGGCFHDIADAQGIVAAVHREVGDALEVVYSDVRVHIAWEVDSLKVDVLGSQRIDREGRSLTLHAGDLVGGQELDLLIAVGFPPGDLNVDRTLGLLVSDGDRPLAEDGIRWTYVNSAARKAQPRSEDVERRVAEYHANQARLAALAANREGDFGRARGILRDAAKWIRHYGHGDAGLLALADALEAEVERHREALSPREVKAAMYRHRNEITGRGPDGSRMRIRGEGMAPRLQYLPVLDSAEQAARCRQVRAIPPAVAKALGESAIAAIDQGFYRNAAGQAVDWQAAVAEAVAAKRSLPPDEPLPAASTAVFAATRIRVVNEDTLEAARRLAQSHTRVLALNFANGVHPGGGLLEGHRGQESVLCRSSALYATLRGDPMYAAHRARPQPDSTDWAILSPQVPVFRTGDGATIDRPWTLGILSCAAPYAPKLGQEVAAGLMRSRARRVLAIARAHGYPALVLGAWGCGTYGNDPGRIAEAFHSALREQAGAFAEVVFAIADWSPERRFLVPFAAELSSPA